MKILKNPLTFCKEAETNHNEETQLKHSVTNNVLVGYHVIFRNQSNTKKNK